MKNTPQTINLTTSPIADCLRHLAVPAGLGLFFQTMFNVVDTYFAGEIGTTAQAALTQSFPVFFLIIAVGSGLQVGATALIANALGAKDRKKAAKYTRQSFLFNLFVGGLLTGVGLVTARSLFTLLGASGELLETSLNYMLPIFGGTLFFILNAGFNAVLQASGDTKSFRNMLMGMSILNIFLDPLFIYGGFGLPEFGVTGIALATLCCQMLGSCYMGFKAWRTGLYAQGEKKDWSPQKQLLKDLAQQGLPAGFNLATIGLGIFVITRFVGMFGEHALAAYGIATRIEQVALLPALSLNISVLTLVAQNYGAKNMVRVRETLNKALFYGFLISLFGFILLFFLSPLLMGIFTDDPLVLPEGERFLRIMSFLLYAYVVLFVHVACMQGIKKPMFALWIGLWRQIVAPVTLFSITTLLLNLGINAVWWGIFAINASCACFTWIYVRQVLKKIAKQL